MATKLAEWSLAVKARDGRCMDCGSINDLHAHHIKPKSAHPELMLDISNGRTLCYRCHKAEHERNRSVRVRSKTPHRKTLQRVIAELESQLADLTARNIKLNARVSVCKRGACESSLALLAKHQKF